jgi:hypothetical protein
VPKSNMTHARQIDNGLNRVFKHNQNHNQHGHTEIKKEGEEKNLTVRGSMKMWKRLL